jgi:AraC-like DNA-binding protein
MTLFGSVEIGDSNAFGGIQHLLGDRFRTRLVPHVHPHYVLGVIDAGSVEVTVRGESIVAGAGSVLALRPFEPHTEIAAAPEGWSFRYLYPTERVVRASLELSAEAPGCALELQRHVIDDDVLAKMIGDTHLWMSVRKPRIEIEQRFTELFARLRQTHCVDSERTVEHGQTARRIDRARRFIIESAPRRVRIPDLAHSAGLSEFHFHRLFREIVGLSAYAFFDRVRVARAHELLYCGYTASQVAHLLEFADQPHFTRHFVRASCFAPRQLSAAQKGRVPGPWAIASTSDGAH